MARLGAQAIGLYYKTPEHLLPAIAGLLRVGAGVDWSIVDPCAADGEALFGIAGAMWPDRNKRHNVKLYAVELEATRYERLSGRRYSGSGFRLECAHGDAMRATWALSDGRCGTVHQGAGLLFVNSPYHDSHVVARRFEERFLQRFAPCLADRGVLVDVRPFRRLADSADTIAREFTDLHCYRFPDGDFDVFKQIVLVGTKRPTLADPDPVVRAQVMRWSESVEGMSILGSEVGVATIPGHESYRTGFHSWSVAPLDITALRTKVQPWHKTDKAGRMTPILGIAPDADTLDFGRYPLAVPPKPAHIAAAIASGLYSGDEIEPDDAASGLPRLRIKGRFRKENVTRRDESGNPADTKVNEQGDVVGIVEIQQPRLEVTVLDVACGTYHTLKSSAERSGTTDPAQMTTGDLLTGYGRALMRAMLEKCPVLHDPANDRERFPMPTLPIPLYAAQEEAARALVKLLGGYGATRDERRDKSAFLLGSVGVGKTPIALATAQAIGARKTLVMCPPHMVREWTAVHIPKFVPHARVMVLDSPAAVDAFAADADVGMLFGVMSREQAKLGHGYAGTLRCPTCGSEGFYIDRNGRGVESPSREDVAAKRLRCGKTHRRPVSEHAQIAHAMAEILMLVAPTAADVNQLVRGRVRDRMMINAAGKHGGKHDAAGWQRVKLRAVPLIWRLAAMLVTGVGGSERAAKHGADLLGFLAALRDDATTVAVCERLFAASLFDGADHGAGAAVRTFARDAMLLVRDAGVRARTVAGMRGVGTWRDWDGWDRRAKAIDGCDSDPEAFRTGFWAKEGSVCWADAPIGTPECAVAALSRLGARGGWQSDGEPCGEPLYQAIPDPRRYPLADYLAKRHPGVLDLFLYDEAHEGQRAESAQSLAAVRIIQTGAPTIAMTGSGMNGYARSLFILQWALDPEFREAFKRDEESRFKETYGYLKILVQHQDKDGNVVAFGSMSDRREVRRPAGDAPGVMPLFLIRYLLRRAVTIHKADLAMDLPPCREIVVNVEPDAAVASEYRRMLGKLKQQIKADRFTKDKAGKLFGALSEITSFPDRATADCGNDADGGYTVKYPDLKEYKGKIGRKRIFDITPGDVVCRADGLPEGTVLAKERAMLDTVRAELADGRPVMIFAWHEAVLPRLQRLVERELGETCALLVADKVPSGKRQEWIERNVLAKGVRVLVVNPKAVETGLNCLVQFPTQWWAENPGCNPNLFRQAEGRSDRIGKTAETRVYFPIYDNTAQVLTHRLLMHKVAVALAADGLDAEGALAAAGVGEADGLDALSVGKALWEMLERNESERLAPMRVPVAMSVTRPIVAPVAPAVEAPAPVVRRRRRPEPPAWVQPSLLDLLGTLHAPE